MGDRRYDKEIRGIGRGGQVRIEYIEREKLPQKKERGFFLDDDFNAGWNACLNNIKNIPAADVRPVRRGKWIIVDQGDTACLVECDQCGMHYIVANDVFDEWLASENRNYCPKCGAYMREKNGEEI